MFSIQITKTYQYFSPAPPYVYRQHQEKLSVWNNERRPWIKKQMAYSDRVQVKQVLDLEVWISSCFPNEVKTSIKTWKQNCTLHSTLRYVRHARNLKLKWLKVFIYTPKILCSIPHSLILIISMPGTCKMSLGLKFGLAWPCSWSA